MPVFLLIRRLVVVGVLCSLMWPARAQKAAVAVPPQVANPAWLDKLINESVVLRQHQVGVTITDVATGSNLYHLNDDRYFTPASTMKLFSFYAGLHLLGDSLPSLRYVSTLR